MAFIPLCAKAFLIVVSLWFLFLPDRVSGIQPLLINQIAIDSHDPRIVYAATRPQGVLKSTDQGLTWRPARKGLKNTSAYHIVINPKDPKILYVGTFGGGVYKSENGGENWFEVNHGLGNTNIHALTLNPLQPDQLIVSTSTGELFLTKNAGKSWAPFHEGLPFFPGEVIATLLVFPKDPGGLYLAQQGGLFTRPFSSPTWQPVEHTLHEQVITTLAYDLRTRTLHAGTRKEGLFTITLDSNLMAAQRLDWRPLGGSFQKQWIRLVVLDPSNPSIIYVAAVGRGLFKSTDNGASWKAINAGLPTREIVSLAIAPNNSKYLYAGTQSHGLFLSRDEGKSWNPPAELQVEPVKQIIASLSSQTLSVGSKNPPFVYPPSFAKCNRCHGWTDPFLNQKSTYWRVPPNHRDWRPTVQRMSRGAGLTPEEEDEIIRFLTEYTKQQRKTP